MERLVNRKGAASGAEAELISLVEACEPVSVSELGKKRSLGAVYRRHHQRRRATRFAMRLALGAGVLLVAGAATAAAFGVRWRARPEMTPAPLAVAAAPHAVAHPLRAPVVEVPAPETTTVPAPATAPAPSVPASSGHRAHVVRSEDPSLVVSAIQALRQDHDPARASHLLAGYLRTYPHGALVEEAIALSFEAADARQSPAAATFAQRYLRDFPQGRFRAAAERVLARPTP